MLRAARRRSCRGPCREAGSVEGGIGIGQPMQHETRVVAREHLVAKARERGTGDRRVFCRNVERPFEMLAGMAAADFLAVMAKHLLIERSDDSMLRSERRRRLANSGLHVASNLARQPWPALGG